MKRVCSAALFLSLVGLAPETEASYAPGCTVALNVTGAVLHEARAVAIQHDGRIVVAGYADFGGGRDFLVARLHPDLSLDTSFNGTGYRVDDLLGRDDEAFAVVVQFDQKIVVGGYSQENPSKFYFAFVRYNRDGSLDTSFGGGGGRLVNFSGAGSNDDRLRGLAIQPDGKILGAGYATPGPRRLAAVRLLKNGNLDTSFNGTGAVIHPIAGSAFSLANGVQVQPDGKIVLSGEARFVSSDFLAVRLRPDGSLDGTFNSPSGWVGTDIGSGSLDTATSLALQTDGKIVLAGTSNGNVAVVRYTPAGSLDATFGGGRVVHDFGGTDSGDALTLDSAGNLLVAGGKNVPPSDLAFARFRPDGTLDLSKTDDISGMDDRGFGLAVTRSGKILVAGSSQGPSNPKTTLSLYLPDGNQDCGPAVYPVDVFTAATSGDAAMGRVMLNWLNPSYGPYDRTVIRRDTAGCPATDNDGVAVVSQSDGLGAPGGYVDSVPLGPTYYYAAFVLDSSNQPSAGVCKTATPFDRTSGKIEWSYDTSIAALTTPGLRLTPPVASVVYSVANDGIVHAIKGGLLTDGGGSWPPGFRPFRIWSSAQGRPPIVPLPPTSNPAVMLGAQNGHVFAVDALSGALLWKSPKLGTMIQAAPTVVLSGWGGGADLVFVGTRESGQPNRFVALNANDGTVAWVFDNGGGINGIGMIVGNATVDYAARRVYFTSALGASSKTTWCLDYTVTPPANCWATPGVSPIGGGDIEAAPILHQGSLLVSDTAPGDLYAVDPMTGLDAIFFPLGNGGAKGFVFPQLGTPNVFASTSFETMSVRFGVPNWTESCVATPSTPIAVPGTDWVFVGSNEGKLFQHSASTGGGCSSSACVGNCVDTVVGAPAYDVLKTLLYVGTDDGIIHAIRPPF